MSDHSKPENSNGHVLVNCHWLAIGRVNCRWRDLPELPLKLFPETIDPRTDRSQGCHGEDANSYMSGD